MGKKCGEKYPTAGNAPNFCPNCGADMRELPEPPEEEACESNV